MTRYHFAQALYSQVLGKEMEKSWHLRRDRKTPIQGAEVTCFGKLIHTRAAAVTGKADGGQKSAADDQR